MKQSLQFKFTQNLALTPQLQQAIRLLQLSSPELNQELETLLQENPMLERSDSNEENNVYPSKPQSLGVDLQNNVDPGQSSSNEIDVEDFGESISQRWERSHAQDDENEFVFQEIDAPTLHDHLMSQIKLMALSERDQTLCMLLVDDINEDGYLEQPLEELAELLPIELEIDLLELQTALKHIQHLDPPGVGARDLAECLSLQLQSTSQEIIQDSNAHQLALKLAAHHLPTLASRDFAKLKKVLHCDDAELKSAQHMLTQLNPRPGAGFSKLAEGHFIQHEVIVKKIKGHWVASLNDEAVPKLRINQMYADILKRNRDSSNQYLNSQIQEAKWTIKNIQQRFSTILQVAQAIVNNQGAFLEHGEVAMRPLVLREIADELGMHESTVSRVTTRKYMLTPRGIYELKYFFGSHVATENGGTCSATAIRALIKQMVAEENAIKPLSDYQITEILCKQGIVVARRTIAKYRESLNIPAARQRKSL
jgi:RNA polymerase sigma-54 factor